MRTCPGCGLAEREALLAVQDDSLRKLMPWAEYREKRGGDYKQWQTNKNQIR